MSTYSPEFTLATYRPENLRVCVTLVKQVAQIIKRIHNEGYLYLDTKPDNVLVLDSYATRVQLFDLDSLIPMDSKLQNTFVDPRNVRVSFSKGFSAIELQMGKVKKLGRHTMYMAWVPCYFIFCSVLRPQLRIVSQRPHSISASPCMQRKNTRISCILR